ncbi:radical SAM/SPASM domain-containing protein [Nocardia sp. NPDC127606]|uniref:radical SAM/SPASM domain-containing protein n=1 Tax=Nocardia sp. NPDC127606 TaxID=3345406 RepID=UPI00362F5EC4
MDAQLCLNGTDSIAVSPPMSVFWELAAGPDHLARGPVLGTDECRAVIDDLARFGVCGVEIGGGEPTARADFWDLADHVRGQGIALAFDTDGTRLTPAMARRLAGDHRLTARVRLAAPTETDDDAVRGRGAFRASLRAMELLASTGDYEFEVSVPLTRHSADRLDALLAVAGLFGARLRLTGDRLPEVAPDASQRRALADWLKRHRDEVTLGIHPTGDLAEYCGGGADICLIDASGAVFACPMARRAPVGTVRDEGGFIGIWRHSRSLDRTRVTGCPAAPAVARPA